MGLKGSVNGIMWKMCPLSWCCFMYRNNNNNNNNNNVIKQDI
jgi:hypothetical protein